MKTQPNLPDRLRAEKQRTYLKKKELEAEEMSKYEEEPLLKQKNTKAHSAKNSGAKGDPKSAFEILDVFFFFHFGSSVLNLHGSSC